MKPYRDPRLPPSYRHLAPDLAARIPTNRVRHAVERLSDLDADIADRLYVLLGRVAARDLAARQRRRGR